MPKVSAIIPVYNVAPFIACCARALMTQTLREVEFIFVDDASPDASMDILEKVLAEYPDRDVKVLHHDRNKGLPAARNTGLAAATGEYIWHCDSDDWPEPDMLEKMYMASVSHHADYVYCDFFLDFGDYRRVLDNPFFSEPEKLLTEGFLSGRVKFNVWSKLVKRSIYEESRVKFPEGHGMGEDMTMILLLLDAKKTAHVPLPLYHYMKTNAQAFTSTISQKQLDDIRFNARRVCEAVEASPIFGKKKYLSLFKLNCKLPFLMSGSYDQYRLWQQWYPEANQYIKTNQYLPKRTLLVQQWADAHLFPLVWFYSFVINKIFYRGIVRLRHGQ